MLTPEIRREYAKLRAIGGNAQQSLLTARWNARLRKSPFFNVGDGDIVEYEDWLFQCKLEYDDSADVPWEYGASLGEVRELRYADLPTAGWIWLQKNRHGNVAYNRKQALAEVRSWGSDYARRVEKIVENEVKWFRRWLANEWYYTVLTLNCPYEGRTFTACIGGVESDSTEYVAECFENLADEILHNIQRATYPVTEYGV